MCAFFLIFCALNGILIDAIIHLFFSLAILDLGSFGSPYSAPETTANEQIDTSRKTHTQKCVLPKLIRPGLWITAAITGLLPGVFRGGRVLLQVWKKWQQQAPSVETVPGFWDFFPDILQIDLAHQKLDYLCGSRTHADWLSCQCQSWVRSEILLAL